MIRSLSFKAAALFALLLLTSGCGMMMGQMMISGTGLKKMEATTGSFADLRRGANVLILTPFETVGTGYEPARGDNGARLAEGLMQYGTFAMQFHFVQEPGKVGGVARELAEMTPLAVAEKLKLDAPPDYLLTGTILSTETTVAPMHGVVMTLAQRLKFVDLKSKGVVVIDTEVKELFPEVFPTLVRALDAKIVKR